MTLIAINLLLDQDAARCGNSGGDHGMLQYTAINTSMKVKPANHDLLTL